MTIAGTVIKLVLTRSTPPSSTSGLAFAAVACSVASLAAVELADFRTGAVLFCALAALANSVHSATVTIVSVGLNVFIVACRRIGTMRKFLTDNSRNDENGGYFNEEKERGK